MTATISSLPHTLLRLGRVSNLPTVWTNTLAGALLSGHSSAGSPDGSLVPLITVMVSMSCFYVGGMYLNDFFDRDIDRIERPQRPIPSGAISTSSVAAIGFSLLAIGLMILSSLRPQAGLVGILLAGAILLYNAWHKKNPFSPLLMGACRFLVYVAAGAAMGALNSTVFLGALFLACHIVGLSYAARQESFNRVGNLWPLAILIAPFAVAGLTAQATLALWLPLLLLIAVDLYAFRLLAVRPFPQAVPRAVSNLIAATALVDAVIITLSPDASFLILTCCVAAWAATFFTQKFIPGT